MLDTRLKRIAQRPSWNQISAPALSRQVHLRFLWSNLLLFARRRRRDLDPQIYLPIYPNRHLTRSIDRLLRARKLIVKTDPLAQVVHEILAHEVWERSRARACLLVCVSLPKNSKLPLHISEIMSVRPSIGKSAYWFVCFLLPFSQSASQSTFVSLCSSCAECAERTNERTNKVQ